tara:strand:- start:213 stop:485 length:273 start_codon:yes stop_codon:yes gene_type:complete
MAKTYTITVDDHIHKALETEFLDPEAHFDNFVDHRYKLLYDGILPALIKYCNENSIGLAVGEAAQIDQAFSLGVVKKAIEQVHLSPGASE